MKKRLLIKYYISGSIFICSLNVKSQTTVLGNNNGLNNPTWFLGWNAPVTVPVKIEHQGTSDINFLTGGILRMKINGVATGTNQGFVAIGNGVANNKLDVFAGDIDVNSARRSYMIADSSVLRHKGGNSNIFVGVGAGQNHFAGTSVLNTLIGSHSGFNLFGGANAGSNVFVGANAGFNYLDREKSTLIGTEAGYNISANNATFIGYRAGFSSTQPGTTGNTFIGTESGYSTLSGSNDNTFCGARSGWANTSGDFNCFFGIISGANSTTGDNNCFFGVGAGNGNTTHSNNNYFGLTAGGISVGDDNIFVGYKTGNQGVGNKNVILGNNSMSIAVVSDENVTLGYNAAANGDNNNFNVIMGSQATPTLGASNFNVMLGYKTASVQTIGLNNVYVGENTGGAVLTGTNNTFIGSKADVTTANSTTVTNASAIGANAKVTHANHMILGDNNIYVGIGLSNDATGPQNKLEINAALPNATSNNPAVPGSWPGSTGASGLRFRTLTSASTPVPVGIGGVTNTLVLSVDQNGDAVLVTPPSSLGATFGGVCGSAPSGLTSDWEIPLNNFNYVFTGQNPNLTISNVGIGTSCNPVAKLEILQNSGAPLLGSTGLLVTNKDPALYNRNVIGIQSMVNNNSPGCIRIAGWFQADNGPACGGSIINQAIYVPSAGGAVTIGYPAPTISISELLQVNGSARFGSVLYPSDISLKNTVTTLPNSLSQIQRLRPVTFKWNTVSDTGMAGIHAGFIAQEIDTVIPQVVRTNGSGVKTIAYSELIPYLVSAIQTQQKTIDSLRIQMVALTSSVTSCCSSSTIRQTTPAEQNQLTVNLSDKDIIILNQNSPNPFAEQTTITYNVPEKYSYAQMIFSTIEGRILKTVDITKKGKGTLTVYSNDLSSGMYSYSLVVDGKTFDTKKMMKSE